MTSCPLDGSVRVPAETGPGWTAWRCPFCRTVSREEHDPTLTALDDTFDRRQHPGG